MNSKLHNNNNTSGYRGIYFCKRENKWKSSFANRHIGTFCSLEEAIIARKEAERQYCSNNDKITESDFLDKDGKNIL